LLVAEHALGLSGIETALEAIFLRPMNLRGLARNLALQYLATCLPTLR
jgi:hypothetical protein